MNVGPMVPLCGLIDIIFRELNQKLTGDNEVAAMVHGASTDAANKQLIAALSAGRNIVGTPLNIGENTQKRMAAILNQKIQQTLY